MARIFLSHSSGNNAAAIALRDWLISHGWDDLFLDLDPKHGSRPAEGGRPLTPPTLAWSIANAKCCGSGDQAAQIQDRIAGDS